MKHIFFVILFFMGTFSMKSQDFNSEKGDLMLFVKRMYLNQPFEGVKVIDNGLIIICVEVETNSNNTGSISQIANIKAKDLLNKFINSSNISSDFILTSQQNISKVDTSKEFKLSIIKTIREESSGVVSGLELLSNFDVNPTKKVFVFLRNNFIPSENVSQFKNYGKPVANIDQLSNNNGDLDTQKQVKAQQDEASVSAVALGIGKDQNEAIYNAKISALEQIFNSYISSETSMLNDKIYNQILTITNGNIEKIEILSSREIKDGVTVTIKLFASRSKLVSFCKKIGLDVKLNGSIFADNFTFNLKSQENEAKIINTFFKKFNLGIPYIFNFDLTVTDPIKDQDSDKFGVKITSNVFVNENLDGILETFLDLLKGLSIDKSELGNYKKLNLDYYPIIIKTNSVNGFCYLRSKESQTKLIYFFKEISDFLNQHVIQRNTLKEVAPRKIEGDNLNVLYFTNGSTWIPYRLWSKSEYDISIGQKSYSVLSGNGQQLAKFISDNVNKSQSCPILSDDLVFQGLFINDTKKETIEVPLFLVNTACIDKSQPMFKFSYYDWLTIEELKQLKSYKVKVD